MKQRKVLRIKEFNMFGIENDYMRLAYIYIWTTKDINAHYKKEFSFFKDFFHACIDIVGFQAVV